MTGTPKHSLAGLHPKRLDIPALTVISAGLLAAGYFLPICTVRKLWEYNTFSILSGIVGLWEERFFFLAALIFVFSIIFPIAKLAALGVIWFARMDEKQRERLVDRLETLGKWSMLDVFVTAVIIVSIKLGALANAKAEIGLYFFCLSVLLAMVVSGLQKQLLARPQNKKKE